MPQSFLCPQRDQPLLMPVDMREWLPEGDLVFVVLDSAWERRNSDQVGPVRRGAGSMPAFFRISHTVDAETRAPSPASFPWILR